MHRAGAVLIFTVLLSWSALGQAASSGRKKHKFPEVVAQVSLAGQTNPIPTTTIFTPNTDGLFRISVYWANTVPASTDFTWSLDLGWTDDAGNEAAQSFMILSAESGAPMSYSINTGNGSSLTFRANAGAPVTFSVKANSTPSSTTYELFFVVEQLI